jgi:GDP-D-mannose dehydratase
MDNELIGDYILASGTTRSLEYWIRNAFSAVSINDWEQYVESDADLLRSGKEYSPQANISKASSCLNLQQTISFETLVNNMVIHRIRDGTSNDN